MLCLGFTCYPRLFLCHIVFKCRFWDPALASNPRRCQLWGNASVGAKVWHHYAWASGWSLGHALLHLICFQCGFSFLAFNVHGYLLFEHGVRYQVYNPAVGILWLYLTDGVTKLTGYLRVRVLVIQERFLALYHLYNLRSPLVRGQLYFF